MAESRIIRKVIISPENFVSHIVENLKQQIDNGKNDFLEINAENLDLNFDLDFNTIFLSVLNNFGIKPVYNETKSIVCNYFLNFKSTTFHKKAIFYNFNFNKSIYFSHVTFNDAVNFSNSSFNKKLSFISSNFNHATYFLNSTFNEYVNFFKATFNNYAVFHHSSFNKKVDFQSIAFNGYINFGATTFYQEVDFSWSIFNEKVDFSWSMFNEKVSFENTNFYQEVDFSRATFNKEVDFLHTTFNAYTIFTDINIRKNSEHKVNMNFDNIVLTNSSHIFFDGINYNYQTKKFNEKLNISRIKIINTVIKGRLEFNNAKIDKIDFKGSDIIGGGVVNRVNIKSKLANWETASFLKHEAIVRDNVIEALEYKAIEKQLYTKKLLERQNKSIQEWGECFSLWISKISNNHGQDWIKAVRFVVGSWILFFISFYNIVMFSDLIFNKCYFLNIDTFLLGISTYFNPANYDILAEYLKADYQNLWVILLKITAIVIYILGKIAIGYGIYEIVQAFRKFNTKGN